MSIVKNRTWGQNAVSKMRRNPASLTDADIARLALVVEDATLLVDAVHDWLAFVLDKYGPSTEPNRQGPFTCDYLNRCDRIAQSLSNHLTEDKKPVQQPKVVRELLSTEEPKS